MVTAKGEVVYVANVTGLAVWHRRTVKSSSGSAKSLILRAVPVGVLASFSFVFTVKFALGSSLGQQLDDRAMAVAVAAGDAQLTILSILGKVSVWAIAVLAACCLILAIIRRHARAAVGAAVIIGGANVTTQVLKHEILSRPDFGLGVHNSLPSGHVTVVAAATAAVLLVIGPLLRPTVAALGTFATALTALSTIVAGWHRPADVITALLVVIGWCALGVLVAGGRPVKSTAVVFTAFSGAVGALLFIVLIGVRPINGLEGFTDASLVLGAVAVATAAAVSVMAWLCPVLEPQP